MLKQPALVGRGDVQTPKSKENQVARFIDELKRTHSCGALRASDIGKEVVLFGWVANRRDHGSIAFIDLRDREGVTQIVFDPDASAEAHKVAEALRGEWVIGIRGTVRSRGEQFSKKEGKLVSAANAFVQANGPFEAFAGTLGQDVTLTPAAEQKLEQLYPCAADLTNFTG